MTRSQLESALAADALSSAFAGGAHSWRGLLASLVDTVANHDRQLLEELDRLVRARLAER